MSGKEVSVSVTDERERFALSPQPSSDADSSTPSSSRSYGVVAQSKLSLNSNGGSVELEDDSHREDFLRITRMDGYVFSWALEIRYWLAVILTAGTVWLLHLWFNERVVPYRYRRVSLSEAQYVHVFGFVHGAELITVQEVGSDLKNVSHSGAVATSPAPNDSPHLLQRHHSGKMIIFRHMRFIYNEANEIFVFQQADAVNKLLSQSEGANRRHLTVANLKSKEIVERMRTGLNEEEVQENLTAYGLNALILEVPSIPTLLFQECFNPFYIFQAYSVILWCFEQYWIFAGAIFLIAIVSIVQTLLETRRRMTELSQLAQFECEVTVFRNNRYETISSNLLVPGDIVSVGGLTTLPCDMTLLDGGCVVNESMLTGESVPVVKTNVQFPVNRQSDTVIPLGVDSRNTLYSATKIMQLKPLQPDARVLAMVVRTGFATTKGSLILSILYPKPSDFKFVNQSYKFIASLFCLALVGFGISVWQLKVVADADTQTIIVRGFDLITIVVPPSLPLALSVGTNFALMWLKAEKIFCISPARINMAGKVKAYCFDKTGTLTEESLVFMGVHPSKLDFGESGSNSTFGKFQSPHTRRPQLDLELDPNSSMSAMVKDEIDVREISDEPYPRRRNEKHVVDTSDSVPLSTDLKTAMACCQSLAAMDGELIGDPLEQQTFNAANAILQDTGDLQGYQQLITIQVSPEQRLRYGIREQFEFSSALQRMSVMCTDLDTNINYAFVKGSPEIMQTLCNQETIPADYFKVLTYFVKQGYRVIAIGRKQMKEVPRMDKNELRGVVEKDLTFLGLIVLENKVKPESEPTLKILRRAAIRCIMVSGDNPLTCCSVAKECELIHPGSRVFQSAVVEDDSCARGKRIEWIDTEDDDLKLDPLTLRLPANVLQESPEKEVHYELAVTGSAFKFLQDDPDSASPNSAFHRVVVNGQIFARMTPDQKAELVSQLQRSGLYVGMCGDGANDCAALKTAHVGVSLSESEASIAAPFTYQRPNISCIPVLLSEGRSSLTTSFQLFRYMAMYSMIQFGAVILTYFQGSVLGNWQYLYEDLWLVFPLTVFMGATKANRQLSIKRPSGDLLSFSNLSNLFTHIAICLAFQIVLYQMILNSPEWISLDNPDNTPYSYMTTCMYYFSNFQYSIIAVFFALGRPWKANVLTNWQFSIWVVVSTGASAALLFSPLQAPAFFRSDDLVLPSYWTRLIGVFIVIFTVVTALWDLLIWRGVVMAYKFWRKSGVEKATVFGRIKPITGTRVKLYQKLRGEFEASWKGQVY